MMLLLGCGNPDEPTYTITAQDSSGKVQPTTATLPPTDGTPNQNHVKTANVAATDLVAYARTLTGTPYKYASTDPTQGFDCSGFITYVFNHFGIAVPRTSKDFTDVEHEIPLEQASPGDLILFTGTDPSDRVVGHMGIVVSEKGSPVTFIHSTSGKAKGVVETTMNDDYMQRFVKVVKVF
ncbi:C40 family peptidase [Mucilaginibacter terrenus]|nr:C40 family peptidase [Mucilaginibacter terrenus]